MQKNIIKLNENDNHLSLGNLFRIIKSFSINPNSFLQSDLFCIIFNLESIGTSTVNNYCTGIRCINSEFKNYILKQKQLYYEDKSIFIPTISEILHLINKGKYSNELYSLKQINIDNKLVNICNKLYTISKNDADIKIDFSNKLKNYLNSKNYYDFFVEVLLYTILEKVQPIYKENIISNVIEKNLANTDISVNDIETFMQIQLNSGICSTRHLNNLVMQNNPLACFEMASLEFCGYITGKPRYNKAYEYYKKASDNNHPVARWAIGYLFYEGYIGNKSKDDLIKAYNYFMSAKELNCPSAYNSLGLIYLKGNVPGIKKDKKKAKNLFLEGAKRGNVYSYNNLGRLDEENKNYKSAFDNFTISAKLRDSWALNKIGEYYRLGINVPKDLKKAYECYLKSSEAPNFLLYPWSKYNLAIYFYKNGVPEIGIAKNINKTIELLNDICSDIIEANEELIFIYYDLYLKNNKQNSYLLKLKYYINLIENNVNYNEDIKNKIEDKLTIVKKDNIKIDNFI